MRALVVAATLALASCANLSETVIRRTGDGGLVIRSGKDVKMETLAIDVAPGQRYFVKITGYSSHANAEAIAAQAAREAAVAEGAIRALERGIAIGARAVASVP